MWREPFPVLWSEHLASRHPSFTHSNTLTHGIFNLRKIIIQSVINTTAWKKKSECSQKESNQWLSGYLSKCMVCTNSDKQISRTFQGFFKDKLQFSRTEIYLINLHSLTPINHPVKLKHIMESFIKDFYFFSRHWSIKLFNNYTTARLGMTNNYCIWGTEIAFEIKKQK